MKHLRTGMIWLLVLSMALGVGCKKKEAPVEAAFDAAAQLAVADELLLSGDYEESILAYETLLDIEPANVRGYMGLADAYLAKGDTDKALTLLQEGLALTGDEQIADRITGMTQERTGFVAVAGTWQNTLFLDAQGDVYQCGELWEYHRIGTGTNSEVVRYNITIPEKVEGLSDIRYIDQDGAIYMAIDIHDNLYVWGDAYYWRIEAPVDGIPKYNSLLPPTVVKHGIRHAAATRYHESYLLVDTNGDLTVISRNQDGELGMGLPYEKDYQEGDEGDYGSLYDFQTTSRPVLSQVERVFAFDVVHYGPGDKRIDGTLCCAITEAHDLYVWGLVGFVEENGKLRKNCLNTPTLLAKGIVDVDVLDAMSRYSEALFAVTEDGELTYIPIQDIPNSTPSFHTMDCDGALIKEVSCGSGYYLAVDAQGVLYSGGNNASGQLGIGEVNSLGYGAPGLDPRTDYSPHTPLGDRAVSAVEAAGMSSYAVTRDGLLLCWGDNQYGQLGNGRLGKYHDAQEPTLVMTGVDCAVMGSSDAAAKKPDGTLYTWGLGEAAVTPTQAAEQVRSISRHRSIVGYTTEDGALHGVQSYENIRNLFDAKEILQYGWNGDCSFILKTDGTLWGWGDNNSGELGNGRRNDRNAAHLETITTPVKIMDGIQDFICIASSVSAYETGANTLIMLTQKGELYLTGAYEPKDTFVLKPMKLNLGVGTAVDILTVRTWGFFILNDDGELFAAASLQGPAIYVERGRYDAWKKAVPIFRDVAKMDDGILLGKDGTVYQFGEAAFNEMLLADKVEGFGDLGLVYKEVMRDCKDVSGCQNAFLAVTKSGDLYAWGDNEYGQLGLGDAGNDENIFTVELPEE